MKRLNFGCAFEVAPGWVNSDLIDYGQEHVGDLLDGLPFADGYFDYIVANHSLQMIRFDDMQRALTELRRVLRPGGRLRIMVPDALRAVNNYIAGTEGYFPISDELERTADGRFLRYLMRHGDARSAFTFESLSDALMRAGFSSVDPCRYRETHGGQDEIATLDSRESESLVVEAVK